MAPRPTTPRLSSYVRIKLIAALSHLSGSLKYTLPRSTTRGAGRVNVVLSRTKNPSKSPLTKGDFHFPLLEKGGRGIFGRAGLVEISSLGLKLTLTLPGCEATKKRKTAPNTQTIVKWSEEDQCVGSAPGLILGGCHGEDEKEVFVKLCQVVEEAIELYTKNGKPLPPPTSGRDFATKMQNVA
jgi:hypothetical protein